MTDIRFYHLQKQNLDQALPLILDKSFEAGHKTVVLFESEKEVERLNGVLWSYSPQKFLPHGSKKNGYAAKQPIWLTHKDENPNSANVLILTQNTQTESMESYDLCCEMLDGRNDAAVAEARKRWKIYQDAGHEVTYWFQNEQGGWAKK